MTAKTNPHTRTHYGTDAERLAYLGPLSPGDGWVSELGYFGWDGTTWRGGGGPGTSGGLPFLVGPAGLAPYTSFATALFDANAAGVRIVYALSGNYNESFTLPANMEIYGLGQTPAVFITGNIGINGVDGTNALTNVRVNGRVSFRTNTGGATTAVLRFQNVDVLASASAAFLLSDSTGLTVAFVESTFQGSAGNSGFDANVSATVSVDRCEFDGDATAPPIVMSGGTLNVKDSTLRGLPLRTRVATTVDLTNVHHVLMGVVTPTLDLFAGTTCRLHNWVRFENQDPTGTLYVPGGGTTVSVDPGVNLGKYVLANLPPAAALADNVLAFATGLAGAPPADTVPLYTGNGAWRRFSDNTVAA